LQPLRYAGYVWDSEIGLYYVSQRYYDPTVGAFISKDPIKADGELSAYVYCAGDPIGRIDPTGLFFRRIATGIRTVATAAARVFRPAATLVRTRVVPALSVVQTRVVNRVNATARVVSTAVRTVATARLTVRTTARVSLNRNPVPVRSTVTNVRRTVQRAKNSRHGRAAASVSGARSLLRAGARVICGKAAKGGAAKATIALCKIALTIGTVASGKLIVGGLAIGGSVVLAGIAVAHLTGNGSQAMDKVDSTLKDAATAIDVASLVRRASTINP